MQNVFRIFLIFFLTFIWVRYFVYSLFLSLIISAVITIVIDLVLRLLTKKKNKVNNLKIKEKEDAENMFLSLATDKNALDFYLQLAQKECIASQKKKEYITLENFNNKILLYPFLSLNPLSPEDILQTIKYGKVENAQKIVITCGEISKDALTFVKSVEENIVLLDKFSTYNSLYKHYNMFPNITTTYKKNGKLAFKELLAYSFNKSRTKGYFFSAIILFLSTLFIRYNIYYCIMASILVLFALISYFNPYFNIKQSKIILRND